MIASNKILRGEFFGVIVGAYDNDWEKKNIDLRQFILEPLDMGVRVKLMKFKSFTNFDSKTRTLRSIRFIS